MYITTQNTIMRKFNIILLLLFLNSSVFAQCNQYFVLKKGTTWKFSSYNAKGKLQGTNEQKVISYKETDTGFESKLLITSKDEKGNQLIDGTTTLICKDGIIFFDLEDMIPEETMQSFQSFEMTMKGTNVELPNDLSTGQELKDADMTMDVNMAPMKIKVNIKITDRKVLGEEKITTSAGTFDCYKISQKLYMKAMVKVEGSSIEWFAKGIGIVKSEFYNKKGKLSGYSLLTEYSE